MKVFIVALGITALPFFPATLPEAHAFGKKAAPSVSIPDPLAYPARPRGGEFTAATDIYGPLEVREGFFEAEATTRPWSGWWLPLWDDFLFQSRGSELSPLEKYDLFVEQQFGVNPLSSQFEKETLYRPISAPWAGRCDAWALASILYPEPVEPLVRNGLRFRVSDLKSLVIKTFERIQIALEDRFGQRNDGGYNGVFEDIYPEQFHRLMQSELFDQRRPFIMDHDSGTEIWNVPVWRAQSRLDRDKQLKYIIHVQTWVYSVSSNIEDNYDFVGSKEVIREYTYDLFGRDQPDGSFKVEFGVWTGRSQWDHPDYAIRMPEKITRKSANDKIDVSIVDLILTH